MFKVTRIAMDEPFSKSRQLSHPIVGKLHIKWYDAGVFQVSADIAQNIIIPHLP